MRLINVETLKLEEFFDNRIPKYAILSHTWGDDEVTFQDMQSSTAEQKLGYRKIHLTCQQAKSSSIAYACVDTCCIDKTSSAELSESINSMYRWYRNAEVCYVFLSDVSGPPLGEPLQDEYPYGSDTLWSDEFIQSRWFTSGWTLQELIAPNIVRFYDHKWDYIGTKPDLCKLISASTKIEVQVLKGRTPLDSLCIAKRMSWASNRTTSRIEDRAYSLFGLFGVNMPLLYGEGEDAFRRLQEEIIKTSTDQSIFAWDIWNPNNEAVRHSLAGKKHAFLARSPSDFQHGYRIVPYNPVQEQQSYSITNMGLQISLPVLPKHDNYKEREPAWLHAVLNCRWEDNFVGPLALWIEPTKSGVPLEEVKFVRFSQYNFDRGRLHCVDPHVANNAKKIPCASSPRNSLSDPTSSISPAASASATVRPSPTP